MIFKFAPNEPVMMHTHHSPYITLVMQGELRFYRPDGKLKETRYCGSYVLGKVTGEPHTEGAGPDGAVVFFSNRNVTGDLYEFFDKDMKLQDAGHCRLQSRTRCRSGERRGQKGGIESSLIARD